MTVLELVPLVFIALFALIAGVAFMAPADPRADAMREQIKKEGYHV